MTRVLRRLICRALIGVMLFAQLAVAAHACAGVESAAKPAQPMSSVGPGKAMSDMAADARLAGCDQMSGLLDPASPNLCAEHCRYGQQSDQTATPTMAMVVLSSLYTVPAVPEVSPPTRPSAASDSALAAAAPPLAILHCRFRD